jgi:hypothetical protein
MSRDSTFTVRRPLYAFRLLIVALGFVLGFHENGIAQLEDRFHAGAYYGMHLSIFESAYPSTPALGWNIGALLSYDLNSRFTLSGRIGRTLDKIQIDGPDGEANGKYLWADITSLLSYVPIRKDKFDISFGSGISVRGIWSQSTTGIYSRPDTFGRAMPPVSFFLPVQLNGNFKFVNGQRMVVTIEYNAQLRDMYYAPVNITDYTDMNNWMQSYGVVVAYTIPCRNKESI